jgi:tripartite-type tricarboxylate transporter receptor subunit TctC
MLSRRTVVTALAASAIPGHVPAARAAGEEFPRAPIRLVVPLTAGGVGDIVARALVEKAQSDLGQPVVIENRAGGNSVVGTQAVARSRPDGYTILLLSSFGAVVPLLQPNVPYDLERDLIPISGIGSIPIVLTVPGTSPVRAPGDLTEAARARNGLLYASGGVGSLGHLAGVRLMNRLGITNATHVTYRGNNELTQAIAAGQVDFGFPATADILPYLQSKELRPIAITSDQRMRVMPDTPTMAESGVSDFDPRLWFGILAPAGLPLQIKARLEAAFIAAAADKAVQTRLEGLGFTPEVRDGENFQRFIRAEVARWGKVIRDNDIRSE